ncbi:excalibur calcium-binding domain-containing protein [Corynebacterium durum]
MLGVLGLGFANCDAACCTGLMTPIHQGQPGYSPALDHDKDGIVCE